MQILNSYFMETALTTLYRPVGPEELLLIEKSGWTRFPPRLPEQPIFYPVLNEEYATQIARDWNLPASGSGYVTKFHVAMEYLRKFEAQNVGGEIHNELWIPSEELEEFNKNIVGKIEVTKKFEWRWSALLRKLIPYPATRMKVFWIAAVSFKEFAEVKNEVVYGAGSRINVIAPYYL